MYLSLRSLTLKPATNTVKLAHMLRQGEGNWVHMEFIAPSPWERVGRRVLAAAPPVRAKVLAIDIPRVGVSPPKNGLSKALSSA
jgi:hypothetical protein